VAEIAGCQLLFGNRLAVLIELSADPQRAGTPARGRRAILAAAVAKRVALDGNRRDNQRALGLGSQSAVKGSRE